MSDAILLTSQQPEAEGKAPRSSAPSSSAVADSVAMAAVNLVPAGFTFEGLVVVDGAAKIEGALRGDVEGRGRFEIAEGAEFDGVAMVDELVVGGRATGELSARSRLELQRGASVVGSVRAPSIGMADGALLDGRCEIIERRDPPDPKG